VGVSAGVVDRRRAPLQGFRLHGLVGVVAIVLVGVALRWPALEAGLHMDDIAQRAMLEGAYPVPRAWWNLFDFASGEAVDVEALRSRGFLPWWSDPELRLRGLRPLSSALVWFDVMVLRSPWLAHAHSLLWWVGLLVVLHRLLRRVLPDRWATVAVALYALDDCHTFPVAWLANRNALVSTVFALAAVHAHVRAREEGWRRGRWLAPLLAALALAGGEYGIAGLAFVLAYELAGATGPVHDRARALAPVAAVAILYIGIHRVLGYGAANSTVYVDPIADPVAWIAVAADRVPLLLSDMLLGVPLTSLVASGRSPLLLGTGSVAIVGLWLAFAWRRFDPVHRRRIAWMGVGAVGALLPVASSFLSGRLTLVAAVGTHVIVAGLLVDAADRVLDPQLRRRLATWVAAAAGLGFVWMHGPVAVATGRAELETIARLNRIGARVAEAMPVDDRDAATQRWVLLTVSDPMTLVYPPLLRWSQGHSLPAAWWVLSMAPGLHRFERVSPRALEVSVQDGALLRRPVERLFRGPDRPLRSGDTIELDGLTIDVLAAAADGGIERVRFTFDRRLEHESLKFFVFGKHGLLAYPIGRPGVVMTVPSAIDPLSVDESALRASSGSPRSAGG
jgi:hypothetical protein